MSAGPSRSDCCEQRSCRRGAGVLRRRGVSAYRAGRIHACAASAASPDLGRWWPRRWFWRRLRRRRIWGRLRWWRLLWWLLRRWRFVFGRRVCIHHHIDIRLVIGRCEHVFGRFEWIERRRDRYQYRQFDDLVFGPDQFVDGPGVDIDVYRASFQQHRSGVQHQHIGQCFVVDWRCVIIGQCQFVDRRGVEQHRYCFQ